MPAECELYTRIKLLGEGSYGKAYLVRDKQDNQEYVIKQMDMNGMNQQEKEECLKEAKILSQLKHPFIINFKNNYKTKKSKLCIVMEYANGGDLSIKIKNQKNLFSEKEIINIFTQICLAVENVHQKNIIHRDLKCQNIFLNKDGQVKLGDFGIARILNTMKKAQTFIGTPYYLSPEIVEQQEYTNKADIWSLGVILYELCALKPPFDAKSIHALAINIVKGKYQDIDKQYSVNLRNMIKSLLSIKQQDRPNISNILNSDLLKSMVEQLKIKYNLNPVMIKEIREIKEEDLQKNIITSDNIQKSQNTPDVIAKNVNPPDMIQKLKNARLQQLNQQQNKFIQSNNNFNIQGNKHEVKEKDQKRFFSPQHNLKKEISQQPVKIFKQKFQQDSDQEQKADSQRNQIIKPVYNNKKYIQQTKNLPNIQDRPLSEVDKKIKQSQDTKEKLIQDQINKRVNSPLNQKRLYSPKSRLYSPPNKRLLSPSGRMNSPNVLPGLNNDKGKIKVKPPQQKNYGPDQYNIQNYHQNGKFINIAQKENSKEQYHSQEKVIPQEPIIKNRPKSGYIGIQPIKQQTNNEQNEVNSPKNIQAPSPKSPKKRNFTNQQLTFVDKMNLKEKNKQKIHDSEYYVLQNNKKEKSQYNSSNENNTNSKKETHFQTNDDENNCSQDKDNKNKNITDTIRSDDFKYQNSLKEDNANRQNNKKSTYLSNNHLPSDQDANKNQQMRKMYNFQQQNNYTGPKFNQIVKEDNIQCQSENVVQYQSYQSADQKQKNLQYFQGIQNNISQFPNQNVYNVQQNKYYQKMKNEKESRVETKIIFKNIFEDIDKPHKQSNNSNSKPYQLKQKSPNSHQPFDNDSESEEDLKGILQEIDKNKEGTIMQNLQNIQTYYKKIQEKKNKKKTRIQEQSEGNQRLKDHLIREIG